MFQAVYYSLPIHLHKQQLYLLEQHIKSFKSWAAVIWIPLMVNPRL